MKPYKFVRHNVACNLCGSHAHDLVGARDRYGKKLRIVLCTNCGLVFANPMPTDEEVDAFYSRHYRRLYHNAYEPRPKSILKAFRGAKFIHEFLEPILGADTRLLDVGSGAGEAVHYLRKRGIDAHGIEPSEEFARYSIKQYGIPVQISHWQNARIDRESYDVATVHHVVEHFRNPFQALATFRGWLRSEGHLYVSVPDICNTNRTPYGRFHFAHLHYFNRETLIMMALKAGFEVSKRLPGDSTTIVFRKTDPPPAEWFHYPGNYEKMARFFRDYTNARYFRSHKPYTRWVRRMTRLGGDMLKATFSAPKSHDL